MLVDGGCLSTTGHFLSLVRYYGLAELVGEESGATFRCHDNSLSFTLPHTGVRGSVARKTFETAVEGIAAGRGLPPDHPVPANLEDLIRGEDTVLEAALELARNAEGGK